MKWTLQTITSFEGWPGPGALEALADFPELPSLAESGSANGVGVPNLLSWQVEDGEYDTLYEVEISNVTLRSGVTRSYSYPVFIDRANIEY